MFERATTIDGALVEIGRWASSLPGDFPVDAADSDNGITEVIVNGILLSSGIQLSGTLQLVEGDGRSMFAATASTSAMDPSLFGGMTAIQATSTRLE